MKEKPLLSALQGQRQKRPPVWLMRQAGRYLPEYRRVREKAGGFLDLCYTPALAAEVTLQPVERFGLDGAILFSDILVIPDALGQEVWFVEGEGPKLSPIRTARDLAGLSPTWCGQRLEPVYEAVGLVAGQLPEGVTFLGFAGAPWTVATYMLEGGSSRDFETAKRVMYTDPAFFGGLVDLLVEGTVDHLCNQISAGVDAVQLFDTWAGVLPQSAFRRWVVEPARRIVEGVKARYPDCPVIGFPRGVGVGYIEYAKATGVDGLSLDVSVPLDWARTELQSLVTVQGNLDPQLLLIGGNGLIEETDRILEELSGGPFIFNLGHGVIKETPPEHVAALVERVHGAW